MLAGQTTASFARLAPLANAYCRDALATFCRVTAGQKAYKQVPANLAEVQMPTVFVSYSYDDDQHRLWVNNICSRLSKDGISVIYDREELRNSTSNQIIMNKLDNCDWIVPIVSSKYTKKYNSNDSSGVRDEATRISARMAMKPGNPPIIPVIRNNKKRGNPSLPLSMRQINWENFEDDAKFDECYSALLRRLWTFGPSSLEPAADYIGYYATEFSLGSLVSRHNLSGAEPSLSLSIKAKFEAADRFRFADTPATARVSGIINANAYNGTRWAGTTGKLAANQIEKILRNKSHLEVNPYTICLIPSQMIGECVPRMDGYFGFTHIIPVKEEAWDDYENGKIPDNVFPADAICLPNEKTTRFLLFSIGFDKKACGKMYDHRDCSDGKNGLKVSLGIRMNRVILLHLAVLLEHHGQKIGNYVYAQNDDDIHVGRWLNNFQFRPYKRVGSDLFARSADDSLIRRVEVQLRD